MYSNETETVLILSTYFYCVFGLKQASNYLSYLS